MIYQSCNQKEINIKILHPYKAAHDSGLNRTVHSTDMCGQTDRQTDRPSANKPSTSHQLQSREKLQQRLWNGDDKFPGQKKCSWIGNTSAQKKERCVEVSWMDFDGKAQQYQQLRQLMVKDQDIWSCARTQM